MSRSAVLRGLKPSGGDTTLGAILHHLLPPWDLLPGLSITFIFYFEGYSCIMSNHVYLQWLRMIDLQFQHHKDIYRVIAFRANAISFLPVVFRIFSGLGPPPTLGPEHFPQPYSSPHRSSSPAAASTKPPPLMTRQRGLSIISMMRVVSQKMKCFCFVPEN